MIVLKACNLTDDQADRFADEQVITEINDFAMFTADEMDTTISNYNKGLDATETHLRVAAAIPLNRLQALTHRVQVWQMAGIELRAAEWTSAIQANQGVLEYRAFVQHEKSRNDPIEFPADLKPEMLGADGERAFTTIDTTLGQCSSAHGNGASLRYLTRDTNLTLSSNPTIAERTEHNLPHNGEIYDVDNARFFNLIQQLCISHPVWQGIKKYQASKDGRRAYMHLKSSYQGQDHILSKLKAEKKKISEGNEGLKYAGEHKDKWVEYASNLAGAYDLSGSTEKRTRMRAELRGSCRDLLVRLCRSLTWSTPSIISRTTHGTGLTTVQRWLTWPRRSRRPTEILRLLHAR